MAKKTTARIMPDSSGTIVGGKPAAKPKPPAATSPMNPPGGAPAAKGSLPQPLADVAEPGAVHRPVVTPPAPGPSGAPVVASAPTTARHPLRGG